MHKGPMQRRLPYLRAACGAASRYEGDVSTWGRTRDDPYNANSESDYTLSSGISPRGSVEEKRQEFDIDKAKRSLAYNAGTHGMAAEAAAAAPVPAGQLQSHMGGLRALQRETLVLRLGGPGRLGTRRTNGPGRDARA